MSRKMIIEVDQPISGKVKVPGSLFKLSKTPGKIDQHAPFLGENTHEILGQILGYSEQEINKFDDEGII
jgi:CoA:oxalate CoA-transferase